MTVRFLKNHEFTLLFCFFYFLLGVGVTLWYPLFVMCVIGAFLFYAELRSHTGLTAESRWLLKIGACFLVPALISLPTSLDQLRTLKYILTYPLFMLAGYYLYRRVSAGVAIKPVIYFMILTILLWGAFSVWQFLDPNSPFSTRQGHYQGIHSRSNEWVDGDLMLGTILASSVLFICAYLWVNGRKFASVIFFGLVVILILLAGVRSAWVSTLFVFLVIFAIGIYVSSGSVKSKILSTCLATCVSVGVVWATFSVSPYLQSRWNQTTAAFSDISAHNLDSALSGRWVIWQDAVAVGLKRPLTGSGANTFRFAPPALLDQPKSETQFFNKVDNSDPNFRQTGAFHAHQALLDVFSGTGFPGLIGMILACTMIAGLTLRVWRTGDLTAIASIIGWWAAFLPFNTHYNFYGGWSTAWFWVWLGLAVGFFMRQKQQKANQ